MEIPLEPQTSALRNTFNSMNSSNLTVPIANVNSKFTSTYSRYDTAIRI